MLPLSFWPKWGKKFFLKFDTPYFLYLLQMFLNLIWKLFALNASQTLGTQLIKLENLAWFRERQEFKKEAHSGEESPQKIRKKFVFTKKEPPPKVYKIMWITCKNEAFCTKTFQFDSKWFKFVTCALFLGLFGKILQFWRWLYKKICTSDTAKKILQKKENPLLEIQKKFWNIGGSFFELYVQPPETKIWNKISI